MEKIIIVGAAGHSKVVIDILEQREEYEIVGFIDFILPKGSIFMGYPILGKDNEISKLIEHHNITAAFIAIGDNQTRHLIYQNILKDLPKLSFPNAIHPSAILAKSVTLGQGTVIMAGTTVNSSATIGSFCILNTQSSLDHDSTLGDFASLAPRATIGGYTNIGSHTMISISATVAHKTNIGNHCTIGASATVLQELPSHSIAYGTPAKIIRNKKV